MAGTCSVLNPVEIRGAPESLLPLNALLKAWAYYIKRKKRWRLNEASSLLGLQSRREMPSSHQPLPAKYTHTEKETFHS